MILGDSVQKSAVSTSIDVRVHRIQDRLIGIVAVKLTKKETTSESS